MIWEVMTVLRGVRSGDGEKKIDFEAKYQKIVGQSFLYPYAKGLHEKWAPGNQFSLILKP